jgi:tRNA pseudouridine38-40 synthase
MVSPDDSVSQSALPPLGEALLGWKRCWLWVSYDGSAFHGSQYQSHGQGPDAVVLPTVQGAIRQGLAALGVGADAVKVHCASRTDAGVHAMGQVVQLTYSPKALAQVRDLRLALNHYLPKALSVWGCQWDVPLTVCCQHSAKVRWYRYRLDTRPYRTVWGAGPAWRVGKPLNVDAMQAAASVLLGRHDFSAFVSPHTPARDPVCRMHSVCVWHDEMSGQVVVDIAADRFLYKMVRNMVVALVAVGLGHLSADPQGQMTRWLHSRSRGALPRSSAPAHGLMLMAIDYQPAWGWLTPDPFSPSPQELLNKGFFSEHVYVKLLHAVLTLENSQHENIFRQAR